MRSACSCARKSCVCSLRSASSPSSGKTISKASPLLSFPSLLAPTEGEVCDDAGAAQSVEAARMEEGAVCNDASAAPRIFEAKQCFKSCRMSQRMAPSFKASPTVVATFYCSYRCHAAVLGRFGLRVTKRMPSPSSAFITCVKVARKYATHPPRTPWGCTQLCLAAPCLPSTLKAACPLWLSVCHCAFHPTHPSQRCALSSQLCPRTESS